MKSKIWLSSPHMGQNEIKYVTEAFENNWVAPLGPNVDAFENQIGERLGGLHAAALTSGTAALHLALINIGVKPGDVVIAQSFTFCASVNPIVYLGADVVLIDSERETWNIDPVLTEKAVQDFIAQNRKPKCIIPVHLYGMPANMDEILAIGVKYDIPIIEDAAEGLGSTYKGKPCGSLGQQGVLSFNGNKIITTSGGGALASAHKNFIDKARFLSTQARDAAPHYQHSEIGYNYRLSNISAGIGRGQMEVLSDRIAARRANFERYKTFFEAYNSKGLNVRFQEEGPELFSNRWLSCIYVNPDENKGLTRETIRLGMDAENIECRPLWKPMHLQPVYANAKAYLNGTSEDLFNHGLCLPSGSNLTEADWDRIENCLKGILDSFV